MPSLQKAALRLTSHFTADNHQCYRRGPHRPTPDRLAPEGRRIRHRLRLWAARTRPRCTPARTRSRPTTPGVSPVSSDDDQSSQQHRNHRRWLVARTQLASDPIEERTLTPP